MTRATDQTGFTLIETVVALALCALVAGAVASSLSTALRAERRAVELREARRAVDKLHHALLNPATLASTLDELKQEWTPTPLRQTVGEGTQQIEWTVWELSRINDASRRAALSTRCRAPQANRL